ncbi:MAG: YcaO-like family protein [Thermoanaerobaculia bacterium]
MDLFGTFKHKNPAGLKIDRLMKRMVSPLSGLDKTIGYSLHDAGSPQVYIAVAQMTAIHRLVGLTRPPSYHLGGYGLRREEALIRTLGETTERYAHMAYSVGRQIPFASAAEMRREGRKILEMESLAFYTPEQLAGGDLRFKAYEDQARFGWLEAFTLPGLEPVWLPAQLVLIGYRPQVNDGEPWLNSAVTTGSAAHTVPEKAVCSALLELIQMDAAMGQWFSGQNAPEIVLDESLPHLVKILADVAHHNTYEVCFHSLRSPDLPGHVVACVLRNRQREIPAVAVGVATELELESACYKAFLEASAIPHLALIGLLQAPDVVIDKKPIDPARIVDLDMNVAYYSLPENRAQFEKRFPRNEKVKAAEIPRYPAMTARDALRFLIEAFRSAGKRLYFLDLTPPDIHDLGFCVCRTYSPDLLGLCWPSFPAKAHPRFASFGGVRHSDPHPYP